MSEEHPSVIGPYRVLGRLGAGGMGEVFLAEDPRLARKVAVKRLRFDTAGDLERRARLLREARLAAAMSHPSIVQVFDLLTVDGADHIVMEYLGGSSLRERLRDGPVGRADGLRIAAAIADGLAHAHRSGVVHRDLKSENVLLGTDAAVKIADFGIARRADDDDGEGLTREGVVVGTNRAMAPEQACGGPPDTRSDLFSLGVLLYELFTGASPFLAGSGRETIQRVLQHRQAPAADLVPDLPPELSDLIDHLLEKDSALRPRDAQEVADRLRAIAGLSGATGVTLAAPRVKAEAASPRRSVPSRRKLWWTLAAGAVVVVTGVTLAFQSGALRRAPAPLYVAVLPPKLVGSEGNDETAFTVFAIRSAVVSALTSFAEVYPKSTAEVDAVAGDAVAVARAVAAAEVIAPSVACRQSSCSVEISRLRGSDGAILWSGQVEVPRRDLLSTARAMSVVLQQGYGDRGMRQGVPALDVRPEDYAEYLAIRRQLATRPDAAAARSLLTRLSAVRRRSPGFVEAYLLEATLGLKDPARLAPALALLAQAQALAPGYPDVYFTRALAEIQGGRLRLADETLARFEQKAPGDLRALDLRAQLAEKRGRAAEAMALLRRAVERQPSWARLYELAQLAWRLGDVAACREALAQLLERFPGNPWGRQLLAFLELTNGDAGKAASLYEQIAAGSSDPGALVNLGLAKMLLGDYAGSAAAIRQAVTSDPDNPAFLLNLGQALLLDAKTAEAQEIFRRVVSAEAAGPAGWQSLTTRAQAYAHLGRKREAVAAAQEALQAAPKNGQVAFEAALVYCLVGDRTAGLVNALKASELGFDAPAWFELPWFEPLQREPAFRALAARR